MSTALRLPSEQHPCVLGLPCRGAPHRLPRASLRTASSAAGRLGHTPGLVPEVGPSLKGMLLAPRAVTAWGAGPALRGHRLLIAKLRILMKRMFHCFSSVSVHGLSSHAEPVALSEIKQPVGVWGVVCALEQGLPG